MPSKTKIEWADYVSNPIRAVYISVTGESHQVKNGFACVDMPALRKYDQCPNQSRNLQTMHDG